MKTILQILTVMLLAMPAGAEEDFDLRLVPLKVGLSEDRRSDVPEIIEKAAAAGINMKRPSNPFLACAYRDGKLFYVFFKEVEPDRGTRNFMIQRIHKIEKFYRSDHDLNPEIQETFLVEAFKMRYGKMKKADRHQGNFSLRGYARREILKECEIGFAEIPGIAEGEEWPYEDRYLYHEIQGYAPDRTIYDNVHFIRSAKWTLSVSLDQDGSYSVRSPEFGFDAPDQMPPFSIKEHRPLQAD